MPTIEVQGHRGARGLAPENTLAGFEVALDIGVASIETDVHLSRDDVAVLIHDPHLNTAGNPLVRSLTLADLRYQRVLGPVPPPTPVAQRFARRAGLDPCGIPTLMEFFEFVAQYAGPSGEQVGKTKAQREGASQLIFDIELKRMPFRPETIDDGFTGTAPALLERQVVTAIRQGGVLARTRVRSFDHRSVRAIKDLEPTLQTAVLIAHTAPIDIRFLLADASAQIYCPDYQFVDADIVRRVHDAGKRIIPYTVNESDDWDRLLDWGVDGITTDFPHRLLDLLAARDWALL